MKRRRGRLKHEEPDTSARDTVRAVRDAFYARRRGEAVPEPMPKLVLADATPPEPKSNGAEVPEGWRDLHWKQRVKIAKECYPGFQFVNGSESDAAIARYLEVEL